MPFWANNISKEPPMEFIFGGRWGWIVPLVITSGSTERYRNVTVADNF
jgi:hypothetical protein